MQSGERARERGLAQGSLSLPEMQRASFGPTGQHDPVVIARSVSDEAIQFLIFSAGLLRYARNDGFGFSCYYAPIAILGSASAFTFNSFSARRYSTGITLRNFGSHVFQSPRMSAARFEPVSLA